MDRILILMAAEDFADAQTALLSALENASAPASLSFGLILAEEPDAPSEHAMADLGRVQFLCREENAWKAMPLLWQGEGFCLMAHPAMRFTRGWDALLKRQWHAAGKKKPRRTPLAERIRALVNPEEDAQADFVPPIRPEEENTAETESLVPPDQKVLTGYLPVREDPLDAVCPVAADTFDAMGVMTFRHGIPLRYAVEAPRGPFLHPDFYFGPAGFFRALAEAEEPLFLAAFRECWDLYVPVKPAIRLVWDLPVAPVTLDPNHDLADVFADEFGVDMTTGTLSPQSRRGMVSEELNIRLRVPLRVKLRSWQQHQIQVWKQEGGKYPKPHCVTLYTEDMPLETTRWLKRLAALRHLPLTCYADAMLVRTITEFLPNVREIKPRYLLELPLGAPEEKRALSKANILLNARDRELAPSHHVWMDADCLQIPLYAGSTFAWHKLCTDKIAIAMVGGVPDPTMFVVPDRLVQTLSREMEARCLTFINQRGALPTEQELWSIILKEHPDWFQLTVRPVARQLFTLLDNND